MPNEAPNIPGPASPADFVRIEATALIELAQRLDTTLHVPFARAIEILLAASRPVIITGIGKSGIIARKIAATLRSTGTPAHFLHPTEALHGDLGMLALGDTVLALSYSGETEELLRLLPTLKRLAGSLIVFCGTPASTLAEASDILLDISVSAEACSLNLAPTASTTVMLALGDALAPRTQPLPQLETGRLRRPAPRRPTRKASLPRPRSYALRRRHAQRLPIHAYAPRHL